MSAFLNINSPTTHTSWWMAQLNKNTGTSLVNWQKHANKLIGYAKLAFQNHESILKAVQEKMRLKQQADQDFALLVFSFMAGPAISFVSGALQYNASRRLFKGKPPQTPSAPPTLPPKPVSRQLHHQGRRTRMVATAGRK